MTHPLHLSPTELQSYRDEGFILVRGLLSAEEAAFYRAELHGIAGRQGSNDATWSSVRGAGTRLTHCHDVQFRSAAFTRLLVDRRLTGIAQDIIGPNVQLHHTKMFIKPPEKVRLSNTLQREKSSMVAGLRTESPRWEKPGCQVSGKARRSDL